MSKKSYRELLEELAGARMSLGDTRVIALGFLYIGSLIEGSAGEINLDMEEQFRIKSTPEKILDTEDYATEVSDDKPID